MESPQSTSLQLAAIPARTASLPRQPDLDEAQASDDSCSPQVFRYRGHSHRWSLPAGNEDRVRTPPPQLSPAPMFQYPPSSKANNQLKRHTLSNHPPPATELNLDALDRDELAALVRTLHIDALKARRDVVRLQVTLDSVTSQAARERERLCQTIEYQRQVVDASNRESCVLKAQLEEALETLGTMLLQQR
ncbi:hypothetical protein BCR44DRAFT_72782 [Catenaria anguillulae PL171]|uniref:Uncharacterized protein n=1 Tax=Catenaria anguillulae PL171 TaxID=765915 RepID=A0A1Y2HPH0_9FUNG|nr:hypothetical protein BCR44DRAFT_72782 [Catenaria anguillulae PL171]